MYRRPLPSQWADGISISCANSLVENNHIWDATDGGIVVFGSPGSTIRNNTIEATDVRAFDLVFPVGLVS